MVEEGHFAAEDIKHRIANLNQHWNSLKEKAVQVIIIKEVDNVELYVEADVLLIMLNIVAQTRSGRFIASSSVFRRRK